MSDARTQNQVIVETTLNGTYTMHHTYTSHLYVYCINQSMIYDIDCCQSIHRSIYSCVIRAVHRLIRHDFPAVIRSASSAIAAADTILYDDHHS